MKTLLTGMLMATAMLSSTSSFTDGAQAKLEMQILSDEAFQNKVKIFDYSGNLIKEMRADDVGQDQISVADYMLLENSDFAFGYLGDYYYFRD